MGLFHFGKKKETELEKSAEAVEYNKIAEKVNIKEQSCTNDENRRFVMLIEEAFPAQGNDGIVTVGIMHGTIKNGDAVYLLEPGDRICMVNVIGLAIQDGGKMKPVEEAADRITGVKIYDIAGREKVAKYAVLTSVKPQLDRGEPASIENPYVLGLSFGYRKFIRDTDFFDVFISELLMTNVLVSVLRGKDGDAVLSKSDQPGRRDMLVFTDKFQLMLGDRSKLGNPENTSIPENVGDHNEAPRVAALRFVDCIDMVCSPDSKIQGIALNSYGSAFIELSREMLDTIYQSGEFQRIIKEKSNQRILIKNN